MTDKEYDNTDSGVLFRNTDKDHPKQPDYRGNLNVGGTEFWLSAWLKQSKKDGKKFLSLAVKRKDGQRVGPGGARPSLKDDLDDEVPF